MSAWAKAWGAAWGSSWGARNADTAPRAGYGYFDEPIHRRDTDDDEAMILILCALQVISGGK